MATEEAVKTHHRISTCIENRELHDAFSSLSVEIASMSNPKLIDLLKKQEETYKYMLHYLVEGYDDNGRDKMLSAITSALFFINDAVLRDKIVKDSPDAYSSTLRFERLRKNSVTSRLSQFWQKESMATLEKEAGVGTSMRKEADEALVELFSFIWTMFGASSDEYKAVSEAVKNPDVSFQFKSQVISALMLGNMQYFDRKGIDCLLDIYDSESDSRLSARALVALTFIIAANPKRVECDPDLMARLSLWNDSIVIYRQLREIVMSVIRSHDTERISSKMKNEVIPELMKLRPEILNKLKNVSETSDIEMLDINPEWEDLLNKNGLGDKLKELSEMQMEGGDVMMMAFSNLKSFPFFNSVANWFLPFSADHHMVRSDKTDNISPFNELLDMEGVMCDSDKFSFALSLKQMPETQRTMITERMGEQMAQLKEAIAEKNLKSSTPEFDAEVTRFVRDIYRFFKLYRNRNDFPDPFKKPMDFGALPVIKDILDDKEILVLVGEFYFKREYYSEALPLLLKLADEEKQDSLLWEKIGYCHNALNNLEEALKWYKRAELIHPESKWLLKKMALCNRLLNRFEEASEYYARALDSDPDNYHLLMSAGHCMLETGNPAGAVANYYHADYVRPGRIPTWRAISWGELLNGNYDKSLEYYKRISDREQPSPTDMLNAGHSYYLSHRLKDAVNLYTKAALNPDYGISGLQTAFMEDLDTLLRLGGKRDEITMIIEKIKYEIE